MSTGISDLTEITDSQEGILVVLGLNSRGPRCYVFVSASPRTAGPMISDIITDG